MSFLAQKERMRRTCAQIQTLERQGTVRLRPRSHPEPFIEEEEAPSVAVRPTRGQPLGLWKVSGVLGMRPLFDVRSSPLATPRL